MPSSPGPTVVIAAGAAMLVLAITTVTSVRACGNAAREEEAEPAEV